MTSLLMKNTYSNRLYRTIRNYKKGAACMLKDLDKKEIRHTGVIAKDALMAAVDETLK